MGMVDVPDARVDRLAEIYDPKKKTYARLEIVEAQAPAKNENRAGLDPAFLNMVKPMDALLLIVRAFDGPEMCEPAVDVRNVVSDMILGDLVQVETRLERLALDKVKGRKTEPEEIAVLEKARDILSADKLLIGDLTVAESPWLRNFALLTAKPLLVLANVSDAEIGLPTAEALALFGLPVAGLPTFVCSAKVDEEIQDLPPEERAEFQEALGITEPALNMVIREVYRALGLISFLTGGKDEVRAWTITKGTLAPRAAGAVHSDIEKGFIRAEIIHYDDFNRLGSEAEARKTGKYRLEGKEYAVNDGDIINFRFNI
jgi:GTP-binding protein YchF